MKPAVLILTTTVGYRHSYIPTAVEVLTKIGERTGRFEVFASEEIEELRNLDRYRCVIFLTCGDIEMGKEELSNLISFVRKGGGFLGVHNATDTLKSVKEYTDLIGGVFNGHPWRQKVTVIVEDREHPSTRHLPARFRVEEEVYTFDKWSRDRTHVLISLDVRSVDLSKGNRKDNDYALSWCHKFGEGKVLYTAFGHFPRLWREEWFQRHLFGALEWLLQ
ncbi:hypothetical protein B6U74_06245 [Candidatus Bathyarchaeota archaeon ex4484_205]|nr:MAG: hypothetical protein B6U74_06245 [Candidatus Bathyarchaeota archaeon ex4484_205]RLG69055.1 MAG: ThuA domain-containing protein [archaeon]HDN17592.1 ThuA domain-containing protein [Candidatus Bathyarchaeota archaeon]